MEKISVLLISVPLMIVAIVCALFADRIDTAVQGNKKTKKDKKISEDYDIILKYS